MNRRLALITLLIILLTATLTLAQEATPTPVETPTETPTLTVTPSETSTETATSTPAETLAATASETSTETATSTVTETQTETATEELFDLPLSSAPPEEPLILPEGDGNTTTNFVDPRTIEMPSYAIIAPADVALLQSIANSPRPNEFTIYLLEGIYIITNTITIRDNNVNIYGRGRELTILEPTVGFNGSMIRIYSGSSMQRSNLDLSHIQMRNGYYDNNFNGHGAAILIAGVGQTTAKVTDSSFVNNEAERGGAILVDNGGLQVERSVFINNRAVENGSAIYAFGRSRLNGATIYETRFENNYAFYGGSIYTSTSSLLYPVILNATNNIFVANADGNSNSPVRKHLYHSQFGTIADARDTWWQSPSVPVQNALGVNATNQKTSDPGIIPALPVQQIPSATSTPTATATITPTSTSTPTATSTLRPTSLPDADIVVNTSAQFSDTACTLTDAILAANTDQYVGNCIAGNGADRITFERNGIYTFLYAHEAYDALPLITTEIEIVGRSGGVNVLQRGSNANFPFRILNIGDTGILSLNNITIQNGFLEDENGGGIYNVGTLTLLNNSAVERNRTSSDGGGIYNAGTLSIIDSRIQRNVGVEGRGGGIFSAEGKTVTVSNSCIVFNTARNIGGIYSVTPVNTTVNNNWWGDVRGPSDRSRPDTPLDQNGNPKLDENGNPVLLYIGKGDRVSNGTQYGQNMWLASPPSNVVNCIDYSNIFFNTPDGVVGQPGLAGEVYVRITQIINREPSIEEIFAFVLLDAGWDLIGTETERNRLIEALARVYYNQTTDSFIKNICDNFVGISSIQAIEQISPPIDNPTPNQTISQTIPYILCGLGVTEWYGEEDWAEEQAYEFVDFLSSNRQDLLSAAVLISSNSSIRNTLIGIDEDCLNWETGDEILLPSGSKPCPFTWGNYSIFPAVAVPRMAPPNQVNVTDLTEIPIYFTNVYFNVTGGSEMGLEIRFAVNGSGISSGFLSSSFFILTIDQRDILFCGSRNDGRRLWVIDGTYANYPLCRVTRPSDAPADLNANQ